MRRREEMKNRETREKNEKRIDEMENRKVVELGLFPIPRLAHV